MTAALILFLTAMVVPVFFARIAGAPIWLALQALGLAWIVVGQHELSMHSVLATMELIVMRGILTPYLLLRAFGRHAETRIGLMPSNLFSWAIAMTLGILAFKFGYAGNLETRALALGGVALSVTLALLVLTSNRQISGQLVALLLLENAVMLFETQMQMPWPLPVHLMLGVVYVLTVVAGTWLLEYSVPLEDSVEHLQ